MKIFLILHLNPYRLNLKIKVTSHKNIMNLLSFMR